MSIPFDVSKTTRPNISSINVAETILPIIRSFNLIIVFRELKATDTIKGQLSKTVLYIMNRMGK